jgi:hypothetical protein
VIASAATAPIARATTSPGEGHLAHEPVPHQRLARGRAAVHDRHEVGVGQRRPQRVDDRGDGHRGEGRGLDHDGVAGHQRRGHLEHREDHRRVPRGHRRHHAERHATHEQPAGLVVDLLLGQGLVGVVGAPAQPDRGEADLAARVGQRLAELARQHGRQGFDRGGIEGVGRRPHEVGALGQGPRGPSSPGSIGGAHHGVDVRGRRDRHRADDLAGVGGVLPGDDLGLAHEYLVSRSSRAGRPSSAVRSSHAMRSTEVASPSVAMAAYVAAAARAAASSGATG